MSSFIDKKFINIVSAQLQRFKWKKDNLANCRCPVCGDSSKNQSKARGFFYQKNNDFFYKCHNCNYGSNLYNFLDKVSPSLCKEYALERFRGGENGKSNYKKPEREELFRFNSKPKFKSKSKLLEGVPCVKDLPTEHPVVKFVNMRQIPKQHWDKLYFTDDFGTFTKRLDPEGLHFFGKEDRLVIPFFDKEGNIVAAQGRAINFRDEANARRTVKYITVKSDKSADRLWYGQWRVDPKKKIYIVEGPLDSLFLRNAIAMVGAGALDQVPEHLKKSEGVYVLDNEPRNLQIVRYNERLIELGKTICVWPNSTQEKDINDMVYTMSTRKIEKLIDQNTYSGLEATLKLNEWRKV
mgnify:FL=1|tara:strand:- start:17024 stop:18079 length:1056 start_codon:yes stop_codon:yes gene_type:complete